MIPTPEIYNTIQDHLQRLEPLSIVRCGDGESIVLNGYNDVQALKMVYKRQLGETPTLEGHEEIRDGLTHAYNTADIIGVPTQREKHVQGYWGRVREMLVEHTNIGSRTYMTTAEAFTSIDFPYHFLTDNLFEPLLRDINTLCYISCRNIDYELKERFGIKHVISYIIAPEKKFTSGYEGAKHYPAQFNEIRKWIGKMPVEGNLCLYGAGVIGKVYGAWFKEHGGIAVDIGSVFDSWGGYATRGPERGMDKVDETYKL